ncbi:LPS export ABC transporter periplasmic protein LptC [Granulosicoccaceae sp. 1_MG-2023]|nr:LPS export ABC transporter periplasmic protein LptC [Granulosicoccaceae sp. 1_MG-2023]
MKWNISGTLLLIILLVLAISSFLWLDQPETIGVQTDEVDMASLKADYYLENFETLAYDESGRVQYRLKGDTLLHYPANAASEIIAPVLTIHQPQRPSWTLQARAGWLAENDRSVRLNGEVQISRSALQDQPAVEITTSEVLVRTEERQLETDAETEIRSDGWVLRSTGLRSDMTDGTLSLLSNVRATYDHY